MNGWASDLTTPQVDPRVFGYRKAKRRTTPIRMTDATSRSSSAMAAWCCSS